MTSKEKAKELVSKLCGNNCTETNINRMVKCALICVDEILDTLGTPYNKTEIPRYNFWQEVKKEIEKL